MNITVFVALQKAFKTQFHPKMIQAIFLPFIVGVVLFAILMLLAWSPLKDWLYVSFSSWPWVQWLEHHWGGETLTQWSSYFIAFALIMAVSGIAGLASAAVFVTPMAIGLLSKKEYHDLEKKGVNANRISIFNAVKVSTIFVVGWIVTLPLWLIPMASAVLSIFWSAYALSQMCKVDGIVEHATSEERKQILHKHSKQFWMIGICCGLLTLIPFMGFVMPVYSILACAHYGLSTLREMRKSQISLNDEETARIRAQ